jgi:hypothetical protein
MKIGIARASVLLPNFQGRMLKNPPPLFVAASFSWALLVAA